MVGLVRIFSSCQESLLRSASPSNFRNPLGSTPKPSAETAFLDVNESLESPLSLLVCGQDG